MTHQGDPTSWKDHKEMCEAYAQMYKNREIDENEYRRRLKNLGFNPVESDGEVEANSPGTLI